MKNSEHNEPIPDWKCERYLLGELGDDYMERIRLRAERDSELRARLAELERSNQEILADHPSGVVARQIEAKLGLARSHGAVIVGRRPRWRPRLLWVPAAAALVGAFLLLSPGWFSEPVDLPTIRVKGSAPELSLYRRTATGSERLEDRAVAVEHDLIRARTQSDGQNYGAILSVDGRGILTRHHPPHGDEAVLMNAGSHALDFSYELDDAPRWEIFLLASSSAPFAVDGVIGLIEASPLGESLDLSVAHAELLLHALEWPGDVSLSTLTLIKEAGDES